MRTKTSKKTPTKLIFFCFVVLCFFTKPQRTCSRCQRADDDGVGDFSSGGVTDGPDKYTDTDSGSVSGNSKRRRRSAGKKHNRIPRTSSPRESLMVPKDDQQAELMLSLYRKAREMERKLAGENKRINEVRNLTLLDLTEAASCLDKGNPVSEEIWRKCEKENYGLYGITVRRAGPTGETIPGTKVTSDKGRRGEVVEAKMDEGYTVFTVEWSEGKSNRRSAYSTEDVLRDRDDNQGVATLEEAKEKMGVFLLATLCMVNVQVYRFITKNTKLENMSVSSETRPLARDKKVDITKGRNHAWEETKKARAVDMLMDNEVTFLDSSEDEGLRVEMEEKTCFEMMGLINDARAHFTGLVRSTEDFQDKHLAFVNHFVRGAQASFRLGRPTNMASSMIHLSVNELPPGVQAKTLKEQDTQLYQPGEPTSFSLGMRCVLARARVKDSEEFGDGGSSTCQFLMRYPLYRLLDLSRADNLPLCPTTEHSNHVSPTLRHRDAYSQAFSSHSKRKADLDVFDIIKGGYHSVSQEKRSEKGVIENENERIAFGAKFNKGRTHLVGSDECLQGFLLLEELVSRNGIDSFMEKLPDKDDIVKMCNEALEMNPRKRENEDHLCPPEFKQRIEAIVDELVEGNKVTRSDISLLSCSLTVLDSLLTAALRKQDILGQLAKDLYRMKCKDVHGNDVAITRCLLPRYFKNKKALENSTCGVVVNHTKHEKCEGAYAVMAVIGRKVMRRLLEKEAEKDLAELRKKGGCTEKALERVAESYALTPHLGPFDDKGRVFTPSQVTGMYKWLGQRTMGLSHFGTHIIRSNHATAVAMYCVRTGLSHDDQAVKDLFALARHGDKQRIRFYTKVKGDTPNSCDFLTNLSGALPSLRRLGEGGGVKTSEKKVASLSDVEEVGLSGLFAFEDAEFDKSGAFARGKPVMGDGAYRKLDVVEMDDEEKDLVRQERKATRKANIAIEEKREKEAKTAQYENKVDTGVKSGGRKKGGVRADRLEYRKSAFAKINQLVLKASKLKKLGKGKKPKRMTLEYSLKNDQKTVRVAFHDNVKRFLHSANPGEKDFLDGFYLNLIDGKSRPGSKAVAYAREHRIEWSYHDWYTGNVCVSVPQEKKGGKKRKLVEEGEG